MLRRGPRYLNRVFWELLRFAMPIIPFLLAIGWFEALAQLDAAGLDFGPGLGGGPGARLFFPGRVLSVRVGVEVGAARPGGGQRRTRSGRVGATGGTSTTRRGTTSRKRRSRHWRGRSGCTGICGPWGCGLAAGSFWAGMCWRLSWTPDMLEVADGATVNAFFQAHTFEDRVLKIGRVKIGPGATVGYAAVLLYGGRDW